MTELERLETLDALLWVYTSRGLSAEAARMFINRQFYGQPNKEKVFKPTPQILSYINRLSL